MMTEPPRNPNLIGEKSMANEMSSRPLYSDMILSADKRRNNVKDQLLLERLESKPVEVFLLGDMTVSATKKRDRISSKTWEDEGLIGLLGVFRRSSFPVSSRIKVLTEDSELVISVSLSKSEVTDKFDCTGFKTWTASSEEDICSNLFRRSSKPIY